MAERSFDEVRRDFQGTVERYDMMVVHEAPGGEYLHLTFENNNPPWGAYQCLYEVIRWPLGICIRGYAGAFVFRNPQRLFEDCGKGCYRNFREEDLPEYLEKLHEASREGCRVFSLDRFVEGVKDNFLWFRDSYKDRTDEESPLTQEDIDEFVDDLGSDSGDCTSAQMYEKYHDLIVHLPCYEKLQPSYYELLEDVEDHVYTPQFLWTCCALNHAIKTYDAHKAQEAA